MTDAFRPLTMSIQGQATIPGLPERLRNVPTHKDGKFAWMVWRQDVLHYRVEQTFLMAREDDIGQRARELHERLAREDPAYFIVMFCWVFEPRTGEEAARGGDFVPFVLFAFQVEVIRALDVMMVSKGAAADMVISKSRDMGATWIMCVYSLHGFIFKRPFIVRMISRVEDLVDDVGNMDCMFEKFLSNLKRLPPFLKPNGWDPGVHRRRLKIVHPDPTIENAIIGSSTTKNAGRGGRSDLCIIDEAAFVRELKKVWESLAAGASHRVALSSESVDEGDFFQRMQRPTDPLRAYRTIGLDYYLHPFHDDAWIMEMRDRFFDDGNLDGFEREILRNAWAGSGGLVYPEVQAVEVGNYPWIPGSRAFWFIDPGMDDECALILACEDAANDRLRIIEGYEYKHMPAEYYMDLICGEDMALYEDDRGPYGSYSYEPHGRYDVPALMKLSHDILFQPGMKAHSVQIFGDPTGNRNTAAVNDSWYDRMHARRSRSPHAEHTRLFVQMRWDKDTARHRGRRVSLMNLIPRLDFNDTPGVRHVLQAMQEYRFQPIEDRQAEQLIPAHTWASHSTTAMEYGAVNYEVSRAISNMGDMTAYVPPRTQAAANRRRAGRRVIL